MGGDLAVWRSSAYVLVNGQNMFGDTTVRRLRSSVRDLPIRLFAVPGDDDGWAGRFEVVQKVIR